MGAIYYVYKSLAYRTFEGVHTCTESRGVGCSAQDNNVQVVHVQEKNASTVVVTYDRNSIEFYITQYIIIYTLYKQLHIGKSGVGKALWSSGV